MCWTNYFCWTPERRRTFWGGDYGAFVETQPTSGKVGTAVKILGTDLTGATSVTFNGTAAKLTVVSESEITTSVATGATTGMVEVTTPKGTVKTNEVFRVTQ
jgi:predicted extracellular nuclease